MLRARLVLGMLCLLVILVAVGLYTVDRYRDLGLRVQVVQDENDQMVRSMQDLRTTTNTASSVLLLARENDQVSIRERNAKTGEEINTTLRLMILAMITASIVAIYMFIRITQGFLVPLEALTQSIRKVGEGNLDLRLPMNGKDEISVLARTFNQMSEQLKNHRETSTGRLTQLNRTIQQTIASFPDPIFVLDVSGAVEFRNPSADALAVQLMFAGVSRLPEKVEELVERVSKSGQDHLPTLLKDALCFKFESQDHYYMPRIILLRHEQEKSFGVAIILEEITQALLLDQVKTNLVSTVSHELKTPLTSIRMVLYLLLEQSVGTVNEQQKNLLSTAREDTDRLLKTLNDLLDLTRLEEGPPQMNCEVVSPRDLLQHSMERVQESASASNHRLTLLVEDHLPDVSVDRQRMAYVFDNLLANALKYSSPESGIEVRAGAAGQDHVRFSIKDHGAGIPGEYVDRIFDKFFRVPGTRKTGTGLGLSIAREIVLANHGTIGASSEEGQGSEFYVILPVATASSPEAKI